MLTDGWRKNPGLKEMLMPYMFGVLYVLLRVQLPSGKSLIKRIMERDG